ncbi:uncharacterized protein LOC129729122 [Wyeomyia smithii]|uniref:uncharacterized protein LOC129729122 n=1 Tax=Wyeomyia smithii TaxID=174621 RepID=UPI002467E646|nr:uncharacterized protein LOC129729122 [Wyeomyia smithii]
MSKTCCVPECPRNTKEPTDQPGNFHRFPHEPARIAEWSSLLSIPVLAPSRPHQSSLFVCDRHFSSHQYASRSRLKSSAVPDCHIPAFKQENSRLSNENDKRSSASNDSLIEEAFARNENCDFDPPLIFLNDLNKMCRLCLTTDNDETFESIFERDGFVDYIQQAIGLEVQLNEYHPYKVCQTCIERVNYIYRSREWFHKNDQFLRSITEQLVLEENTDRSTNGSVIIITEQHSELLPETCPEVIDTQKIKGDHQPEVEDSLNSSDSGTHPIDDCSSDEMQKKRRRWRSFTEQLALEENSDRSTNGSVITIPETCPEPMDTVLIKEERQPEVEDRPNSPDSDRNPVETTTAGSSTDKVQKKRRRWCPYPNPSLSQHQLEKSHHFDTSDKHKNNLIKKMAEAFNEMRKQN